MKTSKQANFQVLYYYFGNNNSNYLMVHQFMQSLRKKYFYCQPVKPFQEDFTRSHQQQNIICI